MLIMLAITAVLTATRCLASLYGASSLAPIIAAVYSTTTSITAFLRIAILLNASLPTPLASDLSALPDVISIAVEAHIVGRRPEELESTSPAFWRMVIRQVAEKRKAAMSRTPPRVVAATEWGRRGNGRGETITAALFAELFVPPVPLPPPPLHVRAAY